MRRAGRGPLPRALWTALGMLALGLGALGAVLPLLPTTPFAILAALAFGRGSPRLRRWLVGHRRFGPAVRDWEARGAIARPAKRLACAAMAAALVAGVLVGLPGPLLAIQAACMAAAAAFVLTRPA